MRPGGGDSPRLRFTFSLCCVACSAGYSAASFCVRTLCCYIVTPGTGEHLLELRITLPAPLRFPSLRLRRACVRFTRPRCGTLAIFRLHSPLSHLELSFRGVSPPLYAPGALFAPLGGRPWALRRSGCMLRCFHAAPRLYGTFSFLHDAARIFLGLWNASAFLRAAFRKLCTTNRCTLRTCIFWASPGRNMFRSAVIEPPQEDTVLDSAPANSF